MITIGKTSNNPFKGLDKCLTLYHENGPLSEKLLDDCWVEVKRSQPRREMFFSLLFSFIDITNRHHNIFKKDKRDDGGNADKDAARSIISWMWKNHPEQFKKFLYAGLFNEYSCFSLLTENRVQTVKGTDRVVEVYDMLADKEYRELLADYYAKVLNGKNPFNKHCICKFLALPRVSKRKNHSKMLDETRKVMLHRCAFLTLLSSKMGWEIKDKYNFKGFREFRKNYNQDLESVLFSTGKINEFDQTEFVEWLNKIPAQARMRVKVRVLIGDKWPKQKEWFNFWEKSKEEAQAEQRRLEAKIAQGNASDEEKLALIDVAKKAKVTVGANNFKSLYDEICSGKVDKLKLESFIRKVNLRYDSLVVIDDSGSMQGEPFNFATFLASVCLYKNPNDFGRELLGFFNDKAHFHLGIDRECVPGSTASWWRRFETRSIPVRPFVDPLKSFYENYEQIREFCAAAFQGGCTYLTALTRYFADIAENDPTIKDLIKSFPILTVISDGDLNSSSTARESMLEFQKRAKELLDWEPFIVLIDVNRRAGTSYFTGVPNMIHINNNPAQIEQFLTNMDDMDVSDGYAALDTMYKTNRYDLVRHNVI